MASIEQLTEDLSGFEPRLRNIDRERQRAGTRTDVLLLGSSCIEFWENSSADLAPYHSFNAGVSGSKIGHQRVFFPRIAATMDPQVVVVYAGANDLNGAADEIATPEFVAEGVAGFFDDLRAVFPQIPVVYLAITRAPVKRHIFAEIERANKLIEADIAGRPGVHFLDTDTPLLAADHPEDPVFVEDGLHFSLAGYRVIAPAVLSTLKSIGIVPGAFNE